MDVGSQDHTRLRDDPWIADELSAVRPRLLDYISGKADELDFARR